MGALGVPMHSIAGAKHTVHLGVQGRCCRALLCRSSTTAYRFAGRTDRQALMRPQVIQAKSSAIPFATVECANKEALQIRGCSNGTLTIVLFVS
jgi:hypothetical protein